MPARKDNEAAVPLHIFRPAPRELRAQSVYRLQVGFFGLAGVLLLISLANVVTDQARIGTSSAGPSSTSASAVPAPVRDPLADIGLLPSAVETKSANEAAVSSGDPVEYPAVEEGQGEAERSIPFVE